MKVIICGSCSISITEDEIDDIVRRSGFIITQLVCGMAVGVDTAAYRWAIKNNIPVIEKPFISGDKCGGMLRNTIMVDIADAWIGIIDGRWTPGTKDCYTKAKKAKLPMYLVNMAGI